MFDEGSRYSRTPTYASEDELRSDAPIEGVEARAPVAREFKRVYRVTSADRLDNLAEQFYGDVRRFIVIADAHDELFPCDVLVPGRILRIPIDEGD